MASYGGRRTGILDIFVGPRCSDHQTRARPGEQWCRQISLYTPLLAELRILRSICCFLGSSWNCLENCYFSGSAGAGAIKKGFTWFSLRTLCMFRLNCRGVYLVELAQIWLPLNSHNQHKVNLYLNRRTGLLCGPPQPQQGSDSPDLHSTRCIRLHSDGIASPLPVT